MPPSGESGAVGLLDRGLGIHRMDAYEANEPRKVRNPGIQGLSAQFAASDGRSIYGMDSLVVAAPQRLLRVLEYLQGILVQ